MGTQSFTFKALPEGECPYPPIHCVPFPGLTFTEVSPSKSCFPETSDEASKVASAGATEAMQLASNAAEGATDVLGTMVGDVITTIDALILVCVGSFVVGIVFLVLLRFVIACVVYGSLALVFALLMTAGAVCYVKSGQCADATLTSTGQQAAAATATTAIAAAQAAASGELLNTSNEDMTGVGQDYRGGQTRTRTGKLCQRWDSQVPHNHSLSPTDYPELSENYCRNPGVAPNLAPSIWCYTTDPTTRWQLCTPLGVILPKCEAGYAIESEVMRQAIEIIAYIIWGFAGLWLLIIGCLWSRIRLAVALNKVACDFVVQTPQTIAVPIVQAFIAGIWCILWGLSAAFLVSQVPDGYTPKEYYESYAIAFGTSDDPGKCTDKWPTGFVWKDGGDLTETDNPCSGNMGNTSGITPRCWRCAPPRFAINENFAFSFFMYLWNNALFIAVGQCIVAAAVGIWFFKSADERRSIASHGGVVSKAVKIIFRYHMGSLAFGAFIVAVVQFIRYCMKYLEKQAQAQKNKVMVLILKGVQCCLWCFEKCLKFLNKNAYIQIALLGKNFCLSAKAAFFLILRNLATFGIIAILGSVIELIGVWFICIATVVMGYYVLSLIHPDKSPVVPLLLYLSVGYVVGKLYMSVFQLAVDTCLQCFMIVKDMGPDADTSFVPGPLMRCLPKTGGAKKKKADGEADTKK